MINGQIIALDYPVNPVPRYGFGKAPHPELTKILEQNSALYEENLLKFLQFREDYIEIPVGQNTEHLAQPAWYNGWLPGLDSVALYGFLAINQPKRYFEIGSGNSTKFARRAIIDHNLITQITSFDPQPRAEIDTICDRVIRQPVEEVELTIFQELEAGDILFVDHSHRSFMNSDATVVFLEILPRLKPGVLVEFHDILLPFDYPPEWGNRFYNEQYLLACYLLAEGKKFEIILPNFFISRHYHLSKVLSPLWNAPEMKGVETHGGSFWIRMQ
ncbi:class I SAM-dependent methyltransferase [Desulfotomaculum defluvii]